MRPYRGRASVEIRDALVEPLWSGTRVIAHVTSGTAAAGPLAHGDPTQPSVRLIEDLGVDLAPELPELAAAIVAAVMASEAIIDAVISRQISLTGVGAAPITEMRHRPALVLRDRTELDVVPRGAAAETPEEAADGFVAIDLLSVDGTSLLDVPLLERKRLLESVLVPGALVRTSPIVQPPIDSWVATWKSIGLRGGIAKAANSRYVPGGESLDWRLVERLGGRR